MSDDSQAPPLRLVTSDDQDQDAAVDPATEQGHGQGPDQDPLAAMVQRIEDLPLRERPATFDRVNANLVAELNALEEV